MFCQNLRDAVVAGQYIFNAIGIHLRSLEAGAVISPGGAFNCRQDAMMAVTLLTDNDVDSIPRQVETGVVL